MKARLTEEERRQLDEHVAEAEKRTGVQIVLAFAARSDVYAELPWKAFALGAATAGLTVSLLDLLRPAWPSPFAVLIALTVTLATGAACVLLCVSVPAFARLFLQGQRAETEVRQLAESLFLSRQVFATSGRTGVLLLISLFEHKAVLLPDTGSKARLPLDAQERILARLAAPLAAGRLGHALEEGLAALAQVLGAGPAGAPGTDELPNGIVEAEGA